MSVVPLRYRAVDLVDGASAPARPARWRRIVLWTLAADAVFAAAVLATLAVRGAI